MTKHMNIYEEPISQNFIKLPNFLFEEPFFQRLSSEAKLLYAIILRRAELSRKNNWADDDGRVFIYHPTVETTEVLHCGREKAMDTIRELTYVGLVDSKRQGQGKPNKIYPKFYEPTENREV